MNGVFVLQYFGYPYKYSSGLGNSLKPVFPLFFCFSFYKYFLTESKVHFDSSERNRLHTELWKPWQKLRLFDTDKAMEFLLPFYSNTGRPAKNQPQILRSFLLFFLLYSEGLAKLSLTLWVERLKGDRVLAALIGCTTRSLPPLGSYFDFMDRLWAALKTSLYARDKLLPAFWNSDLDKYYFGYTLFQLSCYNPELRTDIPLLLRFTSARRHDSVSFLVAFHEMEKHMPAVSTENICLDSAMDNYPHLPAPEKQGDTGIHRPERQMRPA